MRNPERLPIILKLLGQIWEKCPDMRLGQLMWAANNGLDPFYIEDYQALRNLAERYGIELDESELPEYFIPPNAWDDVPKILEKILKRMNDERERETVGE